MRPLLWLVLCPTLIGIGTALLIREARLASTVAALGTAAVVFAGARVLDADAVWGWVAASLVLPVPIAFALGGFVLVRGRLRGPR